MSRWNTVKLGDIAEFSNGVNFGKSAYSEGVKLIGVSNFKDRFFPPYEELEEVKEEIVRPNDYLVENDIVFVRSNGNKELVGRCMLVNDVSTPLTFSGFCIRCRIKDQKSFDPVFFTYYFKSKQFRKAMSGTAVGTNIQNLSQGRLTAHEVKIPDILSQHKVADTLLAYEKLIQNNQKQIKLLDEAAQRLYKAWFVDLHFPGYEAVQILDGIPEGWKRQKLIDIVQIQYGFAFDGTLFNSERRGMPIIRIRNIPDGITSDYTTEEADRQYIIHNGDIVVGMDGEFHINTWCGGDSYLVQRTCCIRPNNNDIRGWLLYAIFEPIKYFEKTVVGATVAHLGKKHIDTISLLTGPSELYKPFSQMFDMRQRLLNQNQMLKEARDRLLPKLMTGEIEL